MSNASLDAMVMSRLRAPFGCEFIPGTLDKIAGGRWRIHDANDDAIASCAGAEKGYARLIVQALNEHFERRRDAHMKGRSLNELRDAALKNAVAHGFTDATVAEDVALFHSEASELLEDHRDGCSPNKVWYEEKVLAYDNVGSPLMSDGKQITAVIRHETQSFDANGAPKYKPCGIRSEAADIIVRILHFSGKHEVDIETAVDEKMAYNETRPVKHGKVL